LTHSPPPPPEDHDATLRLPQFSLRTLLIGTSLVALLLALMMAIGTGWSLAILFLVVLVTGHVLGNSLGTRLRDGGLGRATRPVAARQDGSFARTSAGMLPSPTRLRERTRLHWIVFVFTLMGACAGGYLGGTSLASTYPEATSAAHALAYASSGVLGGFAVFVSCAFLSVVKQALREANAGSDAGTMAQRDKGRDSGSVQRNQPS
jgi:hypothetical protein